MPLKAEDYDIQLLIKVAKFLSLQWANLPRGVPIVSTMLAKAFDVYPFLEYECFVNEDDWLFSSQSKKGFSGRGCPSLRHIFGALKYLFQIYLNDQHSLFSTHKGDCVRAFSIGPGFDILEAVVFSSLARRYHKSFRLAYCEKSEVARDFLSQQISIIFPKLKSSFCILNSPLKEGNFLQLARQAFGSDQVHALLANHIETCPHMVTSEGSVENRDSLEMTLPKLCIQMALTLNIYRLLIRVYSEPEYDDAIRKMTAEPENNNIKPTMLEKQQRFDKCPPYTLGIIQNQLYKSFCSIVGRQKSNFFSITIGYGRARFT